MTQEAEAGACPKPIGWGVAGWTLVIAAFLTGFINFPIQVVGWKVDHLPGDPADNRLNNFILEHGYRCLIGLADSFWDAPSFYPAARATTWSDAHLGMLPFYAGFRTVGLSPERAFQGHFLLPFFLNFAATIWALRRFGFGPVGATAGAYVFTFALPLVGQLQHTQLFPRFLVPPAIVFAWEFLGSPRTWRLVAVAACWVGQTYLTVYAGYFLGLLLAVGLPFALVQFRRQLPWRELLDPGWRIWLKRVAVAVAVAAAVLPLALAHGQGVRRLSPDQFLGIAPRPGAWITPPINAGAFPELADWTGLGTFQAGEQQLLPGLLPLLAICLGVFFVIRPGHLGGRGSVVATATASTLLILALTTRVEGTWLYEPLTKLPGGSGIRAVGRVVLILLFPMAIAVASIVDTAVRAASRVGIVPMAIVAVLAMGLVVADQWLTSTNGTRAGTWGPMRYSLDQALARQERLKEAIRRHPAPTLVFVFPSAGDGSTGPLGVQLEAMRASQDLGVPCVNGWSGHLPAGWDFFPDYFDLMVWLTATTHTPPDRLAGMVVVGEPAQNVRPFYNATMRVIYPPQLVK